MINNEIESVNLVDSIKVQDKARCGKAGGWCSTSFDARPALG